MSWVLFREVNVGLATIAFGLVCFVAVTQIYSHQIQRWRLMSTLSAYVAFAALGSVQGLALHAPIGPITVAYTALHLVCIGVCVYNIRRPYLPARPLGKDASR